MDNRYRSFQDIIRFPLRLFMTIGEDIYSERDPNTLRRILLRIYFILGYSNFNAFSAAETAYFVTHITSSTTLLEATAVAPCIGFTVMTDCKQFGMTINRKVLVKLLDDLEAIFPATAEIQADYHVVEYEKVMNLVMIIFTLLCMSYTTSFTFYPAIKETIKYYLLGYEVFERNFGFRIVLPYDAYSDWTIYWITFWALAHCAYVAGISFVCVDLLLIMTITQCTMHFTYIANQLEKYDGSEHSDEENVKFLQDLIVYHSKVLDLSERVNDIFHFLILWNFLSASLVICFAGFQLTAANIEDAILYFIFFTATLVQVFVVCYYGDELVSSSLRIGDAAFNHNWLGCSSNYKRIMKFIIMRSQKAVSIRPPTFPPISFNTFMKVISMAYQFFALLQTTYQG